MTLEQVSHLTQLSEAVADHGLSIEKYRIQGASREWELSDLRSRCYLEVSLVPFKGPREKQILRRKKAPIMSGLFHFST